MNDELFTEARRLADTLAAARHYECGDCWYSCPESEEGCCNDAETECNCSAPECHEAARLIAALLERAERAAQLVSLRAEERAAFWDVAAERDAERAGRERAEAEARQLREAIREHKDRHNSWRQQTQRPSDIALWAALNAAAVAEGAEDRPKFPGPHDRPDTGKECHYLAVTMPHGGLFCNKCGWAEGAEDRGQTDG